MGDSGLTDVVDGKYRVGQTWRFNARPGEEAATLTVVKVESAPRVGVIVHVSLTGLHIKSPRAPGGFTDKVQHAPFSEAAIDRSVTTKVAESSTLPAFEDGYRMWREAFEAGKGGLFTVPVAEALTLMESTINR